MKAIEDCKQGLDKNEYVGWVLMDLSKAFDALFHCLMLAKLHAYGVTNSACNFISGYLSFRSQRVKIGQSKSDWLKLRDVFRKGSVLGPLPFTLFVNDLFNFLNALCKLYNYADNTHFPLVTST